jgi:ring-1,2-phenylacetyl-CoA epoxidase subunit PaaE
LAKFHTLQVTDVVRETADAVSIGFLVPSELTAEYHYKQGQYLTLRFRFDDEDIRRSYSICSAPHEIGELRVAVKKVKGGRVSTFINENTMLGDLVEVMTPMGMFTSQMNPTHKKHYVLIAGGSGITPMLSILKTVLFAEPESTVTLFYANNDELSIIFRPELDALSTTNKERFKVIYILDKAPENYPDLQTGIMTVGKLHELIENYVELNNDNEFFICGPLPMMDNAMNVLKKLQTPEDRIHIEYFNAPIATEDIKDEIVLVQHARAVIIKDGDEYEVEMLPNETVLEAAMRRGLDAPYSCQSGTCATCRAKLIDGNVHMKSSFALTKHDIEAGFILTCQSRPVSDFLVVDYDQAM